MEDTKEKIPHDVAYESNGSSTGADHDFEAQEGKTSGKLARDLKGRHMQMIAIGTYLLLSGGKPKLAMQLTS